MTSESYSIDLTRTARRALSTTLPHDVATGAVELFAGALSTDPHRVGKPLDAPLIGVHSARLMRDWRVLYVIHEQDRRVVVRWIGHRRNA